MRCHLCGARTRVRDSRPDAETAIVRRRRVCDEGHAFVTVEVLPEPDLTMFAVRAPDGELLGRSFDPDILGDRVRRVLLGRKGPFDEATVDVITERSLLRLQRSLTDLRQPLTDSEFDRSPNIVGAISATAIAQAVLAELEASRERPYRMGLLLWAMATVGRNDHGGGWNDAADVLDWIRERVKVRPRYPDGPFLGPREQRAAGTVAAKQPTTVLKRHHDPVPFDFAQLSKSIRFALVGRANADEKSRVVANQVVADVLGERTVSSAQLGVGVLRALRMTDDIAYLRWSVISKRINSVRLFADEAVDLVVAPSPQLVGKVRRRA